MLGDAGGYNCWDTGRGIFHNKDKTFLTWVNEEDHFRFISMQMGGNLGQIYKRLVSVSTQIMSLPFVFAWVVCPSLTKSCQCCSFNILAPVLVIRVRLDTSI